VRKRNAVFAQRDHLPAYRASRRVRGAGFGCSEKLPGKAARGDHHVFRDDLFSRENSDAAAAFKKKFTHGAGAANFDAPLLRGRKRRGEERAGIDRSLVRQPDAFASVRESYFRANPQALVKRELLVALAACIENLACAGGCVRGRLL